jgi:hypothetical protein
MALLTFNDFVSRLSNDFGRDDAIYDAVVTASTSSAPLSSSNTTWQRCGYFQSLPSPLPTGVTSYIPTLLALSPGINTISPIVIGKATLLATLNLVGASGNLTLGSAMPTLTELGNSVATSSAVLVEVTQALTATPGTINVAYNDQDGNAATTGSLSLTASTAVRSVSLVGLASGDYAVRQITNITGFTASQANGVLKFWGITPLVMLNAVSGNSGQSIVVEDFLSFGNVLHLGAGDSLMAFMSGSSAVKTVYGMIAYVGDN